MTYVQNWSLCDPKQRFSSRAERLDRPFQAVFFLRAPRRKMLSDAATYLQRPLAERLHAAKEEVSGIVWAEKPLRRRARNTYSLSRSLSQNILYYT